MSKPPLPKARALRAAGLGVVMALAAALSQPTSAASASGSETVQGLYDTLLSTMKNGRTLGQSGRFVQLEPVVRRTFDIASMARLSVGSAWAKSDGRATPTGDRELWALYLGDLCRAL